MRISSALKRAMYEGVTLGYRTPEWINHGKANDDYWPHSMVKDYRESCIIEPDQVYSWENTLVGYFANWADLVEERGGTLDFVEFIMKWFTTEDMLYYQIAFDSDGTYILSYYNEDRGRRMKMKPGKWLRDNYNRDDHLVKMFAEEWTQMVMKCKDMYSEYSVSVLHSPAVIVHRYKRFHGTDLNSCCSYPAGQFSTGGEHPCMVYGGDSKVDLAVIQDSEGTDFARTLIYNGKYIRVYPTGRSHEHSVAKGVLQLNHIASGPGNLDGAKLNYVKHLSDDEMVVCPYLDGDASVVSLGVRDNGDPCLDVHSRDPDCPSINTQSGNMHERACFDSRTMYINGEHHDYYCDQCEDGFNDGNDYSVHALGGSFCSEDCASEHGFIYAFVDSVDMEWVHRYDTHYQESTGNYYTNAGLEDSGLVLTNHGGVESMDDCVLTTSQGWLLNIDCLFVNTPQEYQETPDNLRPVWMMTDGSGEVSTGTFETFLTDTGQHRSLVEQNIGES